MFGLATSDPIGQKRREIATLLAQAQVLDRQHRYAEARARRVRAERLERELRFLTTRRESIVAHEYHPPARPPGVRAAPYDRRFYGRMYAKYPGYVPPFVMPPRRVPRPAPGPNNVIPPHPGLHRLPNPKFMRHPGRVLTEAGAERTRPLSIGETANVTEYQRLIELWTRRAVWAETNAPARAIFAWSQVDRYQEARGAILRRAGQLQLWQRDVARLAALRRSSQTRALSPGGQRSAFPAAPMRPPGMPTAYEIQMRQRVVPVAQGWEVPQDLPLPGTGPTPLRPDPGMMPESAEGAPDAASSPEAPADAPEEESFLSKYGTWLLVGALALGGAYAYSQSKKKSAGAPARPAGTFEAPRREAA